MAEPKTKATAQSPAAYLKTVEPGGKRDDALALLGIFEKATGQHATMWGTAIVGFGSYTVKKGSKENVWPLVAFSPRKQNLTLYISASDEGNAPLLAKLGKHKVSGSCLHINQLSDVDTGALAALIKQSYLRAEKVHAC